MGSASAEGAEDDVANQTCPQGIRVQWIQWDDIYMMFVRWVWALDEC